jgi:TP901 family phage tail tape measure protein
MAEQPISNIRQQMSALEQLKISQHAAAGTTHKLSDELRAQANAISFSSDALGRGKITLDNFGMATDNAIRKVLLWQIAIEAVYGMRRRLTDMIDSWKDLELTLSRISITTGKVGDQLYKYFQQVSDIAIEFGMPIDQTLRGMDLALRATARITDATKREQTAVQLLRDTSILANLSGMQYSQSIDIMVGSLRQMGMNLDEGGKLLDKWVKVSKNAAVSVNDLAQGFAIMADAASEAGMTVDQVNGVIAALSETVTLGPTEVGNAIRSLMSTLYNTESINLMQKFGVAIEDATGNAKSFWDIMSQLSAMQMSGVLTESQWLALARAAGGGARRYAQFLALLSNWNAAMRISQISSLAQGDALDANRKIVDTLANSFDKFKAAQQKFLWLLVLKLVLLMISQMH